MISTIIADTGSLFILALGPLAIGLIVARAIRGGTNGWPGPGDKTL